MLPTERSAAVANRRLALAQDMEDSVMIRSGLVSITFRKLTPKRIVDLVREAQLDGIEWGGDVHVPHGDVKRAREVRRMTEDAGLKVAAYGSYFRVAGTTDFSFDAVIDCALELGAPTIRVWAGGVGSRTCPDSVRQQIVHDTREMATKAKEHRIALAYEFHANTLTDTTESCLELLKAADHPNVKTYWQPPADLNDDELLASLEAVLPYLSNLHVFHWITRGKREPLALGTERWARFFAVARKAPPAERYAMIEFVLGDRPEQFLDDAKALRQSLAGDV